MEGKKILSVILTLILLQACVTACRAAEPGLTVKNSGAEGETMIYMHIGEQTLTVRPESNSSAEALVELLKIGDITVNMHDYGSFEKAGPLSHGRNEPGRSHCF